MRNVNDKRWSQSLNHVRTSVTYQSWYCCAMFTVRSPRLACPACVDGDTHVWHAECITRRVSLAYHRSLPFSLKGAPKNGLWLQEVGDHCFLVTCKVSGRCSFQVYSVRVKQKATTKRHRQTHNSRWLWCTDALAFVCSFSHIDQPQTVDGRRALNEGFVAERRSPSGRNARYLHRALSPVATTDHVRLRGFGLPPLPLLCLFFFGSLYTVWHVSSLFLSSRQLRPA